MAIPESETDEQAAASAGRDTSGTAAGFETLTDAQGIVTGYRQVTVATDGGGGSYTYTLTYDASWNPVSSSYVDSAGYSSSTEFRTVTDADGSVTGSEHVTTQADATGATSSYSVVFDLQGNVTRWSSIDSAGNTSSTESRTLTAADGTVTGSEQVTTQSDATGATSSYSVVYDLQGNVTRSSSVDSAGNTISTEVLTLTDASGTVTGSEQVTTQSDATGATSSYSVVYDLQGNVTRWSSIDSAGNSWELKTLTDAEGTVTGHVHVGTTTDASGLTSTYTVLYDANWNVVESTDLNAEEQRGGGTDVMVVAVATDTITDFLQVDASDDIRKDSPDAATDPQVAESADPSASEEPFLVTDVWLRSDQPLAWERTVDSHGAALDSDMVPHWQPLPGDARALGLPASATLDLLGLEGFGMQCSTAYLAQDHGSAILF